MADARTILDEARPALTAAGQRLVRRLGGQLKLVSRLALADYRHEWVLSGCAVLALAAVLIPLLVLFGLKYGIITNLLDPLVENPRYREIAPLGSSRYPPQWFADMRARAGVEFIVPRTRAIAASIKLRDPDSDIGRIIDVELIPSAAGDPVLPPDGRAPTGFDVVLLSATTAEKLGVEAGQRVEGLVTRTRNDRQETVRLALEIGDIAPLSAFARDGVFVSGDLIAAVEDFLDGRAVPELDWDGTRSRQGERSFAGFRLYARSIDDVGPLREALIDQGIEVRTSIADIELVKTLDRNLSLVYWIIALIAIVGYCLSFATNVWANVDRKRREFSVLRLTGFRTEDIVWFPVLQAAYTAVLAWGLASFVFLLAQSTLNALFAGTIGGGNPVCRLEAWHLFAALFVTLIAATAAAFAGGRRVAALEPSIGLRD